MLSALLIPCILCGSALYALHKKLDVFSVFLEGAQKGAQLTFSLFPTLLGLLTAVYMLRASGAIDLLANMLQPIFSLLGVPTACIPLALLKPISGSGGLALGSEIIRSAGADSYCGRVAAVMLSASETSLYTISVYCGHIKLRDTRGLLPTALVGDLVVFVLAALLVRC